jgi:hypothetical protein
MLMLDCDGTLVENNLNQFAPPSTLQDRQPTSGLLGSLVARLLLLFAPSSASTSPSDEHNRHVNGRD